MRFIFLFIIFGTLAPHTVIADAADDELLKTAGKAFLQAEAGELIKDYLNRHPPIEGAEGFGSSSLFALQLVLAADSYLKADNDQQRFAAVRSGAAAYVAYSYAATPAVGIIVTAVYLCTQIIEQGVASDYAVALLKIYKEMQQVQLRINDLNARLGLAEAKRFLILADGTASCLQESFAIENSLKDNFSGRATNYREIGKCLVLIQKAISIRHEQVGWLNKLVISPDPLLALLNFDRSDSGSSTAEANSFPDTPEKIAAQAKKNRDHILEIQKKVDDQRKALIELFDGAQESYIKLAAGLFIDEAVEDAQRSAATKQLKNQCEIDTEALATAALVVVTRAIKASAQWRKTADSAETLSQISAVRIQARRVRESYSQRKLCCSDIAADEKLAQLMAMLDDPFSDLLKP